MIWPSAAGATAGAASAANAEAHVARRASENRRGASVIGRTPLVSTAPGPSFRPARARVDWRVVAGQTGTAGRFALGSADRERLRARAAAAVRRARRRGEALAAITVRLDAGCDPTAIAAASRRPGEPWFGFEQPDRDRFALAALGCVAAIDEHGPERFARAARRWRELARHAAADEPRGPRASGPVAVGGFAFAPDGGTAPHWAGFEPASL